MHQVRLMLLAVQFFTRIPITGRLAIWVGFSPGMLRESAAYFPLVGAFVGAVAAAVLGAGMWAFGQTHLALLLASALSLCTTLMLTGAFHEDGLADVADGLGGHVGQARALEIMKDSRVGAYGAIAITMTLLVKVLALAHLAGMAGGWPCATAVIVLAHMLSRACALTMVATLTHVGDAAGSKSKPLADAIAAKTLLIAFLPVFLGFASVFKWFNAIFFIAISLTTMATVWHMRGWFKRRLGGFTGDCLGATQQVCELNMYVSAIVALTHWA